LPDVPLNLSSPPSYLLGRQQRVCSNGAWGASSRREKELGWWHIGCGKEKGRRLGSGASSQEESFRGWVLW